MSDCSEYDRGVQDAFYYMASKLRGLLQCRLSPEGLVVAMDAALDGHDPTLAIGDEIGRWYNRQYRTASVLRSLIRNTDDPDLRKAYERDLELAEYVGD